MAKANPQTQRLAPFSCILLLADSSLDSWEFLSSCLVSPSLAVTCCMAPSAGPWNGWWRGSGRLPCPGRLSPVGSCVRKAEALSAPPGSLAPVFPRGLGQTLSSSSSGCCGRHFTRPFHEAP